VGLEQLLPDVAGVEPDTFVDAVGEAAGRLMNELMDATPVERLTGAHTDHR